MTLKAALIRRPFFSQGATASFGPKTTAAIMRGALPCTSASCRTYSLYVRLGGIPNPQTPLPRVCPFWEDTTMAPNTPDAFESARQAAEQITEGSRRRSQI